MKMQFLTPPDDGSRNTVRIFDRLYQSIPGVAIAVPVFDAPTLEANGWTISTGSATASTTAAYASGAVSGVVTNPGGSPLGLGLRLYIDGSATPVGATLAAVDGSWTISTGVLPAGSHTFSVEVDEEAGAFSVSGGGANVGMDFSNSANSGLLAAIAA